MSEMFAPCTFYKVGNRDMETLVLFLAMERDNDFL